MNKQVQALLDQWNKSPKADIALLTAEMVRAAELDTPKLSGNREELARVENLNLSITGNENLPIRIYSSKPKHSEQNTLIYFHGGGFVSDLEGYDKTLRAIAAKTNCMLVAVQYRLAPEHKFPVAVNDALNATKKIYDTIEDLGGNKNHIAIGGDSSGGNLAAVTCHKLSKETDYPIAFQLLIYPMLDATASLDAYQRYATGFGFSKEKSEWYFDQYIAPDNDRRNPDISPLFEPDLSKLPKTIVLAAELDPLADDSLHYYQKLTEQGIATDYKVYEGMIHGFLQMRGVLDKSKELIDDIVKYLSNRFSV